MTGGVFSPRPRLPSLRERERESKRRGEREREREVDRQRDRERERAPVRQEVMVSDRKCLPISFCEFYLPSDMFASTFFIFIVQNFSIYQ